MDFGRTNELALRVRHRHSDGTWGALDPQPPHHDPADHDPEHAWANATIYVCRTCEEEVQIGTNGDPGGPRD
jgi:hypothetical protein